MGDPAGEMTDGLLREGDSNAILIIELAEVLLPRFGRAHDDHDQGLRKRGPFFGRKRCNARPVSIMMDTVAGTGQRHGQQDPTMLIGFTTSLNAFVAAVQTVAYLARSSRKPQPHIEALNVLRAAVTDKDGRVTVRITAEFLNNLCDQCLKRAHELHDRGGVKVDPHFEFVNDATSKLWSERLGILNFQINTVTTLIEQQEQDLINWCSTGRVPRADACARLAHLREWDEELRRSEASLQANIASAFV